MKEKFGADLIATGHYARIGPPLAAGQPYRLLQAKDQDKDQTYFLAMLDREVLSQVLFPIGEYTKAQVYPIFHAHLIFPDPHNGTGGRPRKCQPTEFCRNMFHRKAQLLKLPLGVQYL